jgi:SAM-dependent methyltransferase
VASSSSLLLFDDLAGSYDEWFATPFGAFVAARERELILRLLAPARGEIVLEVGSGTGYFLRAVEAAGAGCIGLEPSEAMLSVAKARSTPGDNIGFVRARAEALPFPDARFDALLCMTALEFVEDVEAALSEAGRVVRPGARLVFGVLNAEGPWARARRREGGFWSQARFFTGAELKALLSPLGTVRLEYCVHVPPGAGRLPRSLLAPVDSLVGLISPASAALIGARVIRR